MSAATSSTASRTTASTSPSSTEIAAGWTCFVYGQTAAAQRLPIEAGNGSFHVFAISEFDEAKAPGLSSGFVADHDSRSDLKTCAAHELVEFSVRNFVGKVPHEQLLRHEMLPMVRRLRFATFTLIRFARL